jgi:hypothetical protein
VVTGGIYTDCLPSLFLGLEAEIRSVEVETKPLIEAEARVPGHDQQKLIQSVNHCREGERLEKQVAAIDHVSGSADLRPVTDNAIDSQYSWLLPGLEQMILLPEATRPSLGKIHILVNAHDQLISRLLQPTIKTDRGARATSHQEHFVRRTGGKARGTQ